MKLEQSFEVQAPVERVWKTLIDVERVAPCLPGAAVTGRNDDGTYNGSFSVKIGPTTASYTGKLEMQDVDESSHTATMRAQGTDKRGQGGATATILSTLTAPDSDRTRVQVVTDYHITGRLARFGRGGMIEDISQKLLRQFAERLQQSLVGSPEPAGARPGEAKAEAEGATTGSGGAGEPGSRAEEPPVGTPATAAPVAEPQAPVAAAEPPSGPTNSDQPQAATPPPAAPPPPLPPMEPAEPIPGVSLVSSALLDRVRRNPAPLAFVLGLLVAAVVILLRRRR